MWCNNAFFGLTVVVIWGLQAFQLNTATIIVKHLTICVSLLAKLIASHSSWKKTTSVLELQGG